ncbi:MAG TPA: hypothetical protein VEQ59_02310 [Polyangiaceae bacterium]|nr:hypothetical protein [Polyangiaceae bacterium]
MQRFDFVPQALTLWLLSLALGACQAVAGIEERKLDPKLAPRVDSVACREYCDLVMDACQDDNAVYATPAQCLGFCAELDEGDPEEPGRGNTIACRVKQAKSAKSEPEGYCRSAGPGGNGECGTDCEAYCQVFPKICPADDEYGNVDECVRACDALTEQDSFNLTDDHEGDTIECRLVHTASATVGPDSHCPHAPVRPHEPWCVGKNDEPPTCKQYCDIEIAACFGDLAQYESEEQCMKVCAALPPGTNPDTAANTMACRRYHSFNAVTLPAQHCAHSGPTGDGHCGDTRKPASGFTTNCESYCILAERACPDEFASELVDADGCMAACVELDEAGPESGYTVDKAKSSKGLDCRVLYTSRAFLDKTACESAVGGGDCK